MSLAAFAALNAQDADQLVAVLFQNSTNFVGVFKFIYCKTCKYFNQAVVSCCNSHMIL